MRRYLLFVEDDDSCGAHPLRLYDDTRTACFGSACSRLTETEYRIMLELAAARGEVVSKRRLAEAAWGHGYVTDDALKQRVSSLRRKVGREHVESAYGIGYRVVV